MEVLAAFSLSGTILEFARFGMELLSDGRELYKSSQGALSANEQLELATSDLRALLVKLRSRHRPPVIAQDEKDEETFQRILHRAEETAKELVERLERLKVKGPKSRKWESVRKAVQSVWTKDEVEALTKKLERFKDAVETHVLGSIVQTLDQDSLRTSSRFDRLDERTQLIISSLLDHNIKEDRTIALTQEVRDQMDTLIQLVRRTDTVNTNEHHQTRARISKEQVGDGRAQSGGLKEITARFEMLDVSDAEETRLRRKVQADILKSLSYSAMTERYEDIAEAFPETFEWAFKDSTTEQFKWSNLSEWLKEGSGVYWISGKAGSGKSTLMKHIFDDIRTRQYLRVWATGNAHEIQSRQQIPLCLATFFFWNSGTPEQKSQSGLLRALLYQVLSDWPELISVVFPHMWAKGYSDSIETGLSLSFDQALTVRRLTSAFRKLSQQTMVPLKLCFLVDGLDEFYGDHEELATLFKLVTASPMVKVCLSSRPWVIFEQIYGARPSMRLQDLTYLDIYHYVSSNFNRNPAFGRLEVSDPEAAVLLRNEVIEKADGVFLWVDLVVKSLLMGIRNQDDITILRQRLMTMPQKLEDLYRHLLGLIEPVYVSWASKAFQIVRAARELCTDGLAGLKRTEGSTPLNISTFFFAISDENIQIEIDASNPILLTEKVSSMATRNLTAESLHAKYAAVKTHLTARCAGLLEVNQFKQKGPKAPIQFLHQTARDFLQQDDVWSEILGHAKCMGFNPHKAMLKASVMDLAIKSTEKSVGYKEIYGTVKSAMLYAYNINVHLIPNETETWALDSLNKIMIKWNGQANKVHWTDQLVDHSIEINPEMAFLRLATLYGLANYVGGKLAQLDRKAAANIASILLQLLLPCDRWPEGMDYPLERPEMVSTLLHHGADPDLHHGEGPHQTSPWSNMLWYINTTGNYGEGLDRPNRVRPSFLRIMKLLVTAGADLRSATNGVYNAETIVEKYIVHRFPEEGRDLLNEITRQKLLGLAKKSRKDLSRPPRKKKRLVRRSELTSLSRSASPKLFSVPQRIQKRSSNLHYDGVALTDARAHVRSSCVTHGKVASYLNSIHRW